MLQIEGEMIDNAMIFFALLFNICIIFVFLTRAHEHYRLEDVIGILVNLLIVPFVALWLLNIINGTDSARLITGLPIILFLLDDLWYRTIQKKKKKHKPKKWPLHMYLYFLLFLFGGMILTGYVFIVSLFYGFITLSLFYLSWISYGYYHFRYKKNLKKQI